MSLFTVIPLPCPSCRKSVDFETVHSVNADRRPAFAAAILAETFQEQACPHCGTRFRLDPEFNYMDRGRRLWIAAAPLAKAAYWKAEEAHAQGLFDLAYGADAGEAAARIGKGLRPRLTFGWPALREKLLAADQALDDVTLELCKAAVLRNSAAAPISAQTELRLVDVQGDRLVFAWQRSSDEAIGDTLQVARALYDEIDADTDDDWVPLREDLTEGLYVDLNRLMVPSVAEAPVRAFSPPPGTA